MYACGGSGAYGGLEACIEAYGGHEAYGDLKHVEAI